MTRTCTRDKTPLPAGKHPVALVGHLTRTPAGVAVLKAKEHPETMSGAALSRKVPAWHGLGRNSPSASPSAVQPAKALSRWKRRVALYPQIA